MEGAADLLVPTPAGVVLDSQPVQHGLDLDGHRCPERTRAAM